MEGGQARLLDLAFDGYENMIVGDWFLDLEY